MIDSPSLLRRLRAVSMAAGLLVAPGAWSGSVVRLFYDDIPGTTVSVITNAPSFPDGPTFREQLDDFTVIGNNPLAAGLQGKDNSGTQFGSFIRGYLEAPSTGQYVFYIGSDDASELWLSTDHLADGKRRIAFESGAGAPLFGGPRLTERQSLPVGLVRGKRYYFEVLHKQATGGSYIQVGWRRPDGVQEIIPALHLAQYPVDPYLGRGSLSQPPIFNSSGLNAGDLPAEVTVSEGEDVLLPLDVIAAQPTTIEWRRGSEVITGEDLAFLRLRRVPALFAGQAIRAIISNGFGSVTSTPAILRISPDTTAPSIASVDTGGNPNLIQVRFSEPVSSAEATNAANYEVRTSGGALLPVQSLTVLADDQTVQLTGAFGFQLGQDYQLTVRGIRDLASAPNTISPNPSVTSFRISAAAGTTYAFNTGRPSEVRFFGSAKVVPSGSHDGSGFLELTDAFRNRSGAILFAERRDLDQIRVRFKVRLGDGSDSPADGFSVNLANDLPLATLPTPEEGYLPASPGDRLSFTFDTFANGAADASSIGVLVNGTVVTNVLAGLNGVPELYSVDGRWVDVNIDVRRGGRVTLRFDGATVLNQFPIAFEGIRSAQVGFAARTGASWESHWFDDIQISTSEGDVGDVALGAGSELASQTVLENATVKFAVLPIGGSPYRYQWYRDGAVIPGETNRLLRLTATLNAGGAYAVAVSNDFSGVVSAPATLTVQPDLVAPKLVSARGVAGGIREVRLVFDEPLDVATATRPETYSSPILQVLSATLNGDGRAVTLATSGQRAGVNYTLNISGLKDRSVAGNPLTTQITFLSSINYEEEVISDRPSRFWRFEETTGTVAVSQGSSRDTSVNATYVNGPTLGVPALVPSQTNSTAVSLSSSGTQLITVPNGNDINVGGPWTKKSFEFWFRPSGVPAPGTIGLAAAKGIFEEGATARGIMFYLWRDPAKPAADEAELVFHAFNNASDGPGAPFGLAGAPAVFLPYTVKVGVAHHVVGVFDGQPGDTSGESRLYVDGELVGRATGIGQIYAHTGDVQIGRGNVLIHPNVGGNLEYFDGVLDEFALYSTVLSADRIKAHYEAGTGKSTTPVNPATVLSSLETRGNPNLVRLTFNQPVVAQGATNPANYSITTASGAVLPIRSATLLPDLATVDLKGDFNFQIGGTYTVAVKDIADQLDPNNLLQPNPTVKTLTFTEGGPVAIAAGSNLGDRTVLENLTTTFLVVASGAKPYSYQWSFKGAPIPGATNASLTLTANATTAGAYSVTVRNEFSEVTSAPGSLILQSDASAPYLTSIRAAAGSVNKVFLRFSEPLDGASATNAATYSVAGLSVLGATLDANGQDVVVQTSVQTNGAIYQLTIAGLKDLAVVPNILNVTVPFLSTTSYRDELIADGGVRLYAFGESTGTRLASLASVLDARSNTVATASANPVLGVPGLVPNLPGDTALRFDASKSNRVVVPNGSDLNINVGPWSKRSFVFSFQAATLPRGGATPQAPVIFEEGANSRGFTFYLYGTQDVATPTEANLVFHGWNNVAADGAGSPWGAAQDSALSAVFITTPIKAGETYHVVGVFDGNAEDTSGELRLFVNGKLVGTAGGVGQIYNHSGDIAFGQSASYLLHDGRYITSGGAYFDGVLDEFAVLGKALDSARITQLFDISRLVPTVVSAFKTATVADGKFVVTWEGTAVLERAAEATGPFQTVGGTPGRYEEPLTTAGHAIFRLRE
ncbi:MAG: Ig-like domain-containing protein [Verrucomicrobiales bacterium]|nr:Ig-like domain-containing protein [Verrucomicrobiales bacterium]